MFENDREDQELRNFFDEMEIPPQVKVERQE
jgi:hypothetical protein